MPALGKFSGSSRTNNWNQEWSGNREIQIENEGHETGAYYTEWSKSERKIPIQYTNAYILNLERW